MTSEAHRSELTGTNTSPLSDVVGNVADEVAGGDPTAWAMIEASPDALVMVDERGVIELINAQTEKLFGYDRGELLGREVELLVPQSLRSGHRAHRTRYRVAPETRAMGSGLDLVAVRSDGTEFPVEVSLSPMRIGDRLRIIAAVRDITERVQREARDREVRRGLDLVEDGVFMFDGDSLRFHYVNEGAVEQVGYARAVLLTMTPLHIQPEFSHESLRELLEPLAAGGKMSVHFTTVYRHRGGHDVPVEVVLQAMPGGRSESRGESVTYVAVARDISERLAQERELARAHERSMLLEDRARIAREMHDSVISRLFATGLSLDAAVSMVEPGPVQDRIDGAVVQIDDAIRQIRTAVYGNRLRPSQSAVLHGRIIELIADHEPLLGFAPSTDLRGPLERLDDERADHLIATLREALTNAVKYAGASRIDIEVELDPPWLTLAVVDDGIGFDPSHMRDGAADDLAGHGLDNMSNRARQFGGTLAVESSPGRGTTVTWSVRLDP